MENASKALIIAASVLLGIMLISLAVYLIATFGGESAKIHAQVEADRLNQFNTQFLAYVGKESTIYDVITVANLATENNKYYELEAMTDPNEVDPDTETTSYIQVKLIYKSPTSPKKHLEYGTTASATTKDYKLTIENALNQIVQKDIERMNTNVSDSLPKYSCEAFISKITKRVCKVVFTEK